jgi:hypothetical protein
MPEPRPRQSVATEIRNDLLSAIRNQFYPDASPKPMAHSKRTPSSSPASSFGQPATWTNAA